MLEVKKINTDKAIDNNIFFRPENFDEFVWQEEIKKILKTAISSSWKSWNILWHVLFSWPSGYGKTTIAQIIARWIWVNIKIVTGYAISKPSEIISILNNLERWDILFIDEIHRLKSNIEEVLYVAMEDFFIDMVMPEWWNVRIPINPFTLVWATTKMEKLSDPFKNRFVYKFHFMDYNENEKQEIVSRYLNLYGIKFDRNLLSHISKKVESVPREINNLCIKVRDFLISHGYDEKDLQLDDNLRGNFEKWIKIDDWWLTNIHRKYLEILANEKWPIWVKTIALKLWINEQSVENDIEPLLIKLGKVEKTGKWRIIV